MKNLSRIMLHTGTDIYAVQCIRDNIHTRAEVARLTKTADPNYGVLDSIQYKCRCRALLSCGGFNYSKTNVCSTCMISFCVQLFEVPSAAGIAIP